jgi:CRISPR-associated endonuclease/helicase Cas3
MSAKVNWSELWAHTRNRRGEVDPLLRHLQRVAEIAAGFASPFGDGDVAKLAGLLHDAGKIQAGFQDYLRRLEAGEKIARGPQHVRTSRRCLDAHK